MITPNQASLTNAERPTIWGLSPVELHNRFWATRGVQVVRLGQQTEVVKGAELFLLSDPNLLAVFRIRGLVSLLSWLDPDVLWVRLAHESEQDYWEQVIAGDDGEFIAYQRHYGGSDTRLARVALTPERDIARFWQSISDPATAWRELRRFVPRDSRTSAGVKGRAYDLRNDHEVMSFVRDLVQTWQSPAVTVDRVRKVEQGVWADSSAKVSSKTTFIGPVWIGAGRNSSQGETVLGPSVLWDDPKSRPDINGVEWEELEPSQTFQTPVAPRLQSSPYAIGKRILDLVFGSLILLLVSPLFPIIMLAIYLEDGRPFFFRHRRETLGARLFGCLKFRSMCKDADKLKDALNRKNQVDGPQFYIEDDPRMTKVGRILRRFYLDELPQLFNVLAGDMSLVGPRPSPFEENQYCPGWREARMSVLPGITGLWQVMRTREEGKDFQEWIKYDIEYIENISFASDMRIMLRTAWHCLRRIRG